MKLKRPGRSSLCWLLLLAILVVGAVSAPLFSEGCVLSVDPNGGVWKGSSHMASFEMKQGDTLTIPVPEREHYTFGGWTVAGGGWSVGEDEQSTADTGAALFSEETVLTMGGEDVTLTASWIAQSCTVTCVDLAGEEELGRWEKTAAFGSRVNGSDWGDDAGADVYYEGYSYTGCTTLVCQEENPVVYRHFAPCIRLGEEDLFLIEGGNRALECSGPIPQGAAFSSSAPDIVSVEPDTGILTGNGLGKAVITLTLADGSKAGEIVVYCYRPTTYTTETTGVAAYPRILHTANSSHEDAHHDYVIFSQYKQDNPYVSSHGCALCCVAEICQGYGVEDVNPVFLLESAIPEVADKLGIPIDKELGTDAGSRPLGFYGMKQMLASVGISSEQVYNWEDETEAVDEVTQNLSLGRPVVVLIYNNKWNGIQLSSGYHFILLTGIDEDGYVMNVCSSSCRVESTKKSPSARVTVSQLLGHYLKNTKVKDPEDFFFYMPSGSGTVEFLKVTCDVPGERTLEAVGDGVTFQDLKVEETYNWEQD